VTVRSIDSVLADIRRRPVAGDTRIVAVDGPSGSGKSTLAARLARRSGAPVIDIDDFLSWGDLSSWWPRFDREVLTPLLAGRGARYQVRDWVDDEFGAALAGWKTTDWSPLVVIEGLTCARGEVADRLAYSIWVEAPESLRLERGLDRDGESHRQLWRDHIRQEAAFFTADGTRSRADLRVSGAPNVPHDPDTEVVVDES
jgi:uridine kinase